VLLPQLLASLSREAEVDKSKADGLKPENIGKNRNTDVIPCLLQFGLSSSSLLLSCSLCTDLTIDYNLMQS